MIAYAIYYAGGDNNHPEIDPGICVVGERPEVYKTKEQAEKAIINWIDNEMPSDAARYKIVEVDIIVVAVVK